MIKKIALFALKLISFLIVFAVLFGVSQRILIPKYVEGSTISTANIDTFYSLEKNSIDVLFLGASQMYCSVNAKKLNEEYGIKAFDFGASSQTIVTTYYYLQEALKTQKPREVFVEVCTIYWEKGAIEQNLAWNYTANKLSVEKINSLLDIEYGNINTAICFSFPLLQYHSRWGQLVENDFHYYYDKTLMGYAPIIGTKSLGLLYNYYSIEKKEIPEENKKKILSIIDLCKLNNINVTFFKSPVFAWTRSESKGVKEFMDDNKIKYIDLNDSVDIIGIDPNADFFNETHLNICGAEKVTEYLAEYVIRKN